MYNSIYFNQAKNNSKAAPKKPAGADKPMGAPGGKSGAGSTNKSSNNNAASQAANTGGNKSDTQKTTGGGQDMANEGNWQDSHERNQTPRR